MNKKNKILVGCLALLLVLSVGYALFSDTITINGTATAKGSFDIKATCEVVTEENATDTEKGVVVTVGGTGNCQIDDDTITTTSNLTKPTDEVYYRITYTNDGTIPAVLKSISSSNNAASVDLFGNVTAGDVAYVDEEYYLTAWYGIIDNGVFEQLSDSYVSAANLTLQPGEEFDVYIMHAWGDVQWKEQPTVPEDGATINYNATVLFEQVTN